MIEGLETFGKRTTPDCDEIENEQIVEKCRRCITLLSERIRDLRHLKVQKRNIPAKIDGKMFIRLEIESVCNGYKQYKN